MPSSSPMSSSPPRPVCWTPCWPRRSPHPARHGATSSRRFPPAPPSSTPADSPPPPTRRSNVTEPSSSCLPARRNGWNSAPTKALPTGSGHSHERLRWHSAMMSGNPTPPPPLKMRGILRALEREFWEPLQLPAGTEHIAFSPDSRLHFLPISALLDRENRPLSTRLLQVTTVTSGRDLIDPRPPPLSPKIHGPCSPSPISRNPRRLTSAAIHCFHSSPTSPRCPAPELRPKNSDRSHPAAPGS